MRENFRSPNHSGSVTILLGTGLLFVLLARAGHQPDEWRSLAKEAASSLPTEAELRARAAEQERERVYRAWRSWQFYHPTLPALPNPTRRQLAQAIYQYATQTFESTGTYLTHQPEWWVVPVNDLRRTWRQMCGEKLPPWEGYELYDPYPKQKVPSSVQFPPAKQEAFQRKFPNVVSGPPPRLKIGGGAGRPRYEEKQ